MKKSVTELLRLSFLTIYIVIVAFLLLTLLGQDEGIGMASSLEHLSIEGTVSVDGNPFEKITDDSWHNGVAVRHIIILGHFSHDITDANSIVLWPRNLRIKLYVNDELRISTGQREEFPDFIQYAGNSFKIFYIGDVLASDDIRIEIGKAYESCRINVVDSFIHNIYAGREGDVYRSVISHELIHPFIGFAMLFVGILVSIASLGLSAYHFYHMRQIRYLGWFCILAGISYIYDSSYEFIDLLFPHPVFNTLIDLCCIPLLLFFFLMYINNVLENPVSKRFMKWVTILFTTLEVIPLLLQFGGIKDLHEVQDQYVLMGGTIVIFGFVAIIYEYIYCNNKEMKKVLIATLPFAVSLCLKIINVIREGGIERTYIRLGILVSCVLLLNNTFKYIIRSFELIEKEQQMKQEIQNAHVAIMLSQIQPHFLYNALNTLQHICKKDGALAAEAIEHFSRYLRGNMDSLTEDKPIPFTRELKHVNDYLYIQKLRFGDRIHVEYDLQVTNFSIPTLTLQPIVENAIRHGITKQEQGGTVKVTTKQVHDEILIIVSDDGIGFDQSDSIKDNRRHIGIENVRKRLKLQCDGVVEIETKPGAGTRVTIHLKGMRDKNDESHGS